MPSGSFGDLLLATDGAGSDPGNVCRACSPTTTAPFFFGSNRGIKLTSVRGPPASSHGSQKLYEAPSSDLLMWSVIWSAGNTYRRVGRLSVGSRFVSSKA